MVTPVVAVTAAPPIVTDVVVTTSRQPPSPIVQIRTGAALVTLARPATTAI
jgi:hypothetical protein